MHSADPYADAKGLLEVRIRSIEEVDVLLLLRASDRAWNVSEVAQATQIHPELVRGALTDLLSRGLVMVHGAGYSYAPSNFAVDRAIGELERLNRNDRAELLSLLSSTAMQRVRSGVSELLAEALRRNRRGREH